MSISGTGGLYDFRADLETDVSILQKSHLWLAFALKATNKTPTIIQLSCILSTHRNIYILIFLKAKALSIIV